MIGAIDIGKAVEDECCICITALSIGTNPVSALTCGHVFHHECITKVFHLNSSACPVCRTVISNPAIKLFLSNLTNKSECASSRSGDAQIKSLTLKNMELTTTNATLRNIVNEQADKLAGLEYTLKKVRQREIRNVGRFRGQLRYEESQNKQLDPRPYSKKKTCWFQEKCIRTNCPFIHYVPCRNGGYCHNPCCTYEHERKEDDHDHFAVLQDLIMRTGGLRI